MPHEPGRLCTTRIEHLSVSAGKHEILSDVHLTFHCGEITAVIGPNGAGKTTFLRALLGLLPHEGRLLFQDAHGHPARPPRIGYVPQYLGFDRLSPGTVGDLFAACLSRRPAFLGVSKNVRTKAAAALAQAGAGELLDAQVGHLSGGELQRVMLALALTPMPDLLLLDEPVSGVDARGLLSFYQTVNHIRQTCDLTCILVLHDLATVAQIADKVLLLNGRVLAHGTPDEVYSSQAFTDLFSLPMQKGGVRSAG